MYNIIKLLILKYKVFIYLLCNLIWFDFFDLFCKYLNLINNIYKINKLSNINLVYTYKYTWNFAILYTQIIKYTPNINTICIQHL